MVGGGPGRSESAWQDVVVPDRQPAEPVRQRTVVSNGAVSRAVGGVSRPADPYERDAARVADRAGPPTGTLPSRVPPGAGLDPGTRAAMVTLLGEPFDDVRLHTNAAAGRLAAAAGAAAVTAGRGVYFAAGQYRPDTGAGRRLLVHELAHTRQAPRDGVALHRAGEALTRTYLLQPAEPDVFLFPGTATPEQVSATLFGDPRLASATEFVPTPLSTTVEGESARGVRVRRPAALTAEALGALRAALDGALAADVERTVGLLGQAVIGAADESALAELTLRWSQRSDIPTVDGGSYFDAYLGALGRRRLSQPDWYSLGQTETTKTALEWLLVETEELSEQVKKAIELRSTGYAGSTGYAVTDSAPVLATGDVVGRFYWSRGAGIQIRIQAYAGAAPTEEAAVRLIQGAEMGVVLPHAEAGFAAYTVGFPLMDPLVQHPFDDEGGQFYWYRPGTRLVAAHRTWDEATRTQFQGDVRGQSADWRDDLVRAEAAATEVRVRASAGILPDELRQSWLAADRAMILVSDRLAGNTAGPGNAATVAALRDFLDRARRLVSTMDVLQPAAPESGAPPAWTNPYLDEGQHQAFLARLDPAAPAEAWRRILTDYHVLTDGMDRYLVTKLKERGGGDREAAERLEFAGGVGRRLDELVLDHPTGRRIRATFYPQDLLTADAKAGAITCLFYVYREGTTWHLVDLTTPRREKVTAEAGGSETSPPRELFAELNTRLRFPHGRLYWEMPDGSILVMPTTEPMSLSDWLTLFGLGLAVLGLTVGSLGAATPATLILMGSALAGAAAAGADIAEKAGAGVLTGTDVVVDVASIIGSLASLGAAGAGRVIASSALKTGSSARFATFLDARVYRQLIGASLVAEGVTLVVATDQALDAYREAAGSGEPDASNLALRRLVAQLLLTGGIALLAVRGDIADFRRGRNLYLDTDFGDDVIARPLLSEKELTARLAGMSGIANPDELSRLLARSDVDSDLAMRIRADLTQALADGAVTPESVQRVLSGMRRGANLAQLEQALAELRHANRAVLGGAVAEGGLVHIGVKRSAGAVDLGAGRSVRIDPVDEADLLYLGADGRVHLDEVKHTMNGLTGKLRTHPGQFANMRSWQAADRDNRVVRVAVEDAGGWTDAFGSTAVLRRMIDAGVPLEIAGRVWSPAKMQQIWDATEAKARELGMWPPRQEFFDKMATLENAEKFLGIELR